MKDFLTRVAERALGTAPRIDPQATSRYAPARLPLPEARSPLPQRAAQLVSSPRMPRAHQFDIEQEPAEKTTSPSLAPVHDERGNVPEQPRKFDQSSLLLERTPSAAELAPEPEVTAERITRNSVVASVPHGTENPTSIFSAPFVSNEIETAEVLDEPAEVSPLRAPSIVENKTSSESKREVRALKIAERVVDEIPESVESLSPPAVEVVVERPPQVSQQQQPPRAAVSPIVAAPPAVTGRRPSDRPERREKTIQVKIGRVEVHAPPAPFAPGEPSAPPAPKVSLAEFLRQHNRRRDE